MDVISYALSKKIAAHVVSGVQSMSVNGQTLTINTKDSGVLTMTFPTPKDGVSVTDIDVNANNQIVFTMSDGSEFISGKIPTVKGEPGFSPTITENADNTDKIYKLDITTADSTFTTPNLKGADGQGGGGDSSVTLTQEEYEALTEEEKLNGLYYIYDTKRIYKNGVQYGASEPIPLTMAEYEALKEAGAIDEQQEYLIEADDEGILISAEDIGYNNAKSGIQATTVQDAIDKIAESGGSGEKNVQSDWNETDDTADGFIKNKPTIPDAYDDTALSNRVKTIEDDYAKSSDIPSLSGYATETWINEQGFLTQHQDLSAYATKDEIPTVPSKVSELTNDSNYQTAEQVNSTVTTEIAKVVADAPEDFDTLKEMSDWLTQHDESAAAMNTSIKKNADDITALQTSKADQEDVDAVLEDVGEINSNLVQLEFGENSGGKNLADISKSIFGWLNSMGELNLSTDYKTTDFIKVDGDVFINGISGNNVSYCVYDSNKKFLRGVPYYGKTSIQYTYTSGDAYIKVSYPITKENTFQIEEGTKATPYEPYISSVKMLADEVKAQNESLSVIGKCKNLFKPTLKTTTLNGVTCMANGDGTYTLKGKSTSSSNINFVIPFSSPFKGKCKLIGCPSDIDSIAELQCNYNGVWDSKNTDHGKGSILDSTNLLTDIAIVILPNVTVNNLVFKPMITTDLNATYDDFVPYTGDGDTLTHDVAEIKNDLGGLKFSLKHYDNVEIDSTHNVAFVDKSLLPVDITRIKAVFVDGDNCISARRNSESNIIVTKTGDVTSLNFDLLFLYE